MTQYKDRIDKLLTETQKAHEAEKERFKDIMESCVAMKQQSTLCQVFYSHVCFLNILLTLCWTLCTTVRECVNLMEYLTA